MSACHECQKAFPWTWIFEAQMAGILPAWPVLALQEGFPHVPGVRLKTFLERLLELSFQRDQAQPLKRPACKVIQLLPRHPMPYKLGSHLSYTSSTKCGLNFLQTWLFANLKTLLESSLHALQVHAKSETQQSCTGLHA